MKRKTFLASLVGIAITPKVLANVELPEEVHEVLPPDRIPVDDEQPTYNEIGYSNTKDGDWNDSPTEGTKWMCMRHRTLNDDDTVGEWSTPVRIK